MAAVVPISSLTNKSRCVRIRARVMRLWHAQRPGQMPFGMNFLLRDDKGGAIQGLILAADYNRISGVFAEGRLCEFGRFTVRYVAAVCRIVDHAYSLLFSKDTVIIPVSDASLQIPMYCFNLKRLEDITGAVLPADTVVDVVCRISGFGVTEHVVSSGRPVCVRNMYVSNERGHLMEVSLWGQFTDALDAVSLADRSALQPVIVVCNALQVREFRGLWGLKTFVASRFYIDLECPDVTQFRERLPSGQPPLFVDGPSPLHHLQSVSLLSPGKPSPRKVSVAELVGILRADEVDSFECVAEVHAAQPYTVCTTESCSMRDRKVGTVPWYRLQVEVTDGTGVAEFVLIGKQGDVVVGVTAAVLLDYPNPSPDDAPPKLLEIIGKRFTFVVTLGRSGVYAAHRNFTVSQVSPVSASEAPLMLPAAPPHLPPSAVGLGAAGVVCDRLSCDDSKLKGKCSEGILGDEVAAVGSGDNSDGADTGSAVDTAAVAFTPPSSGVLMGSDICKGSSSACVGEQGSISVYAKRKLHYCASGDESYTTVRDNA